MSNEEITETSPEVTQSFREAMESIEDAANGTSNNVEGIAILGSHPETVEMAPMNDPKWLKYACSPHNVEHRMLPPVVDEWFEVHIPIQDKTRSYHYLRTLEQSGVRVWMRPASELDQMNMNWFKEARPYPEEDMKKKFCPFAFTSSIAFIFAKAIDDCEKRGIKKIGIFGVMQASETEYFQQRPGIQYFIWEADKRGIQVQVPEQAQHLFAPPKENF